MCNENVLELMCGGFGKRSAADPEMLRNCSLGPRTVTEPNPRQIEFTFLLAKMVMQKV